MFHFKLGQSFCQWTLNEQSSSYVSSWLKAAFYFFKRCLIDVKNGVRSRMILQRVLFQGRPLVLAMDGQRAGAASSYVSSWLKAAFYFFKRCLIEVKNGARIRMIFQHVLFQGRPLVLAMDCQRADATSSYVSSWLKAVFYFFKRRLIEVKNGARSRMILQRVLFHVLPIVFAMDGQRADASSSYVSSWLETFFTFSRGVLSR